MDVEKQVDFWKRGSAEDLQAARSLADSDHRRHALFFTHLSLEKMLKAHVTLQTGEVPPRTHNLVRLADIAELPLTSEHQRFLREFGVYQLEGRYPDATQLAPDRETVRREIAKAEEVLEWLTQQF